LESDACGLDFALGDLSKCSLYLKQFDEEIINLNQQTEHLKSTPLHIACQMDHIEIVKLLISHPKIDINLADCQWKKSLFRLL